MLNMNLDCLKLLEATSECVRTRGSWCGKFETGSDRIEAEMWNVAGGKCRVKNKGIFKEHKELGRIHLVEERTEHEYI